jgi:DNA-binding SARP family transcriptional activator
VLRVCLLGELRLEVDGEEVPAPLGRPVRALLGWLALHPGRHARADVAAALWPDVLDRSARASLRTALSALRASVGGALSADRDTVGLADVRVDALEFTALAAAGQYEKALALGDADLLPGLQDEWALLAREAHRERRGAALGALAEAAAERGEHEEAVRLARRRTGLDPFDEPAHRELMGHLVAAGDVAGALAEYERLADRLRRELAVAPSAATRELAASIRAAHGGPAEGPGPSHSAASAAGGARGPGVAGAEVPTGGRAEVPVGGGARPPFPPLLAPARFAGAFVGRADALEQLCGLWSDVRDGARRAALVAGPPGIGKTRLIAALAAEVHQGGGAVLAGVADEEAGEPLSPVLGALAAAGRALPAAGEVAADARAARLARLDALVEALERAAGGAPLLLVLDDVHWADEETLRLLVRIARMGSGPLLVLATSRLAAPAGVRAGLDELGRALPLARVELGGLERDDVAALAQDRGVAADVDDLLARTAGNPFFVEALLAAGGERTPARVIDAVATRAAHLGAEPLAVLRAAALLGRTIDAELAAEVAGVDPLAALDAVEAAGGAGLVATGDPPAGAASGSVLAAAAFAHALVQDALLDGLAASERARLHARAAEFLGRRADAGDSASLGAAARHALAGSPPLPATDAIALATRAATALLAPAPSSAAELLERALGRATATGEAALADELRCRLGEALAAADRPDDARAAFEAAAAGARVRGDAELLARTALGAAGPGVTILRVDPDRVAALEEALTLLEPTPSPLRARLQARLAIELAYAPDARRREDLSARALDDAHALDDHRAVAAALGARHVVLWGPEHTSERLALADEMLVRARRAGDPALELQARTWRIVDLTELGDGAAVDAEIDAYAEVAARSGLAVYGWYVPAWRATRATMAGRWDEADRLLDRAVALGERAGDGNAGLVSRLGFFQRALAEEAWEDVPLDYIAERVRTSPAGWAYRQSYIWVLAALGREDEARAEVEIVREAGGAPAWPRDTNWISAVQELSEAAWLLRDRELGAELHALAAPFADRIVSSTRALHVIGSVAGVLARLEDLLGDRTAAAAHYEDSIARCERAGAHIWAQRDRRRLDDLLTLARPRSASG